MGNQCCVAKQGDTMAEYDAKGKTKRSKHKELASGAGMTPDDTYD